MTKLVYHVATTLDNFIAHTDGSIEDFLTEGDRIPAYLERSGLQTCKSSIHVCTTQGLYCLPLTSFVDKISHRIWLQYSAVCPDSVALLL